MLIPVLFMIGFAGCLWALFDMWEEVKGNAFCHCATWMPSVAAFAFFPLLNFAALALAIWAINEDRKEN